MNIPLYSFLILYLVFLVVFLIFYILVIYHIHLSASYTMASFVMTFMIGILSVLTIYSTWYLTRNIDWKQNITLFDSSSYSPTQPPSPFEEVEGSNGELERF